MLHSRQAFSSSPGVLLNREQPSGSPRSGSRSVPVAHNALGPEQPIVQLENVLYPAPEMFAKFANFTVIATLTRGIPLPLGVIGHEGSTVIVVLNGLQLLKTRGMAANRYADQ
jgi:hypothetical protein